MENVHHFGWLRPWLPQSIEEEAQPGSDLEIRVLSNAAVSKTTQLQASTSIPGALTARNATIDPRFRGVVRRAITLTVE